MNYFLLTTIIVSFIFNIYFCNEEKEVKYIITEITSKYPYKDEKNYFYENYTNNYLFAKIKLGSHQQIMEMKCDLNLYETYIVKKDIVNQQLYIPYEADLSTTFNTSKRFYSQKGDFSTALLSKDNLIVNNGQKDIKSDDFYFAYVDEGFKKCAGSIGFNLLKTVVYPEESMNFIDQLKNNDIISGYSLTIKFTSNYNGYLLIGSDLEDIIPNEIENYSKHTVKASGYGMLNDGKWEIDLNRVLVGESELLESKKIKFDLKIDFIIATDEYSEFIFKNFFSNLFGTDKCIREELSSFKYYLGIKCNKDIEIKNFPSLVFDMPSDYEKFHLILDYEDLFEEIGEYKYFKIIVTNNELSSISINDNWIFGKQFFKTNLLKYNKDRKDITLYIQEKKKKEEEEDSNSDSNNKGSNSNDNKNNLSENNNEIWLWILIAILVVMAGIIIYLLIKCFKQGKIIKKRKRLNFLEVDELNDENIN